MAANKLGIAALETVMMIGGLSMLQVASALDRPERTVRSWLEMGPACRNIPDGEVERLCLLIDPDGTRSDLIGWVVLAAKGRYVRSS